MDEDDGDMMETVVPDSDPDDDEDLYAKRLMCEMTDSLQLSHSFKVIPSTKGAGNAEGFSSQVSLLSKQKIHETQTDKYVTEKTDCEKTTEEIFGLMPGTATAHRDVMSQQFRSVVVDLHSTENAEHFFEYRSDRIIAQSRELEFNRDEYGSSAMSPSPVAKASVTSCVEEKVKPFVKKETCFPFSCLPESQIIGLEPQCCRQVAGAASEKCPSASVSGLEPQYSLSCQAAKDLLSVSHVNLSNPTGSSSTVTDTEACTQQMRNVTDRKPSSAKQLSWITINRRNHYGETILFKAVQNGDRDLVKEIIKAGGKVNVTDYAGWTPLHEACLSSSYEMAEELLKQGANVNCGGRMGMTPLHEAVNCGNYWMVRLLLLYGADPSIENDAGETAIGQATDELRKLIEKYSPEDNSRSEKGKTDFFEVLGGEVCSRRETVNTDGTDLCSVSVTDGHGQRTQADAYRECSSSAAVPNKSKSQKNTGSNRQPFRTKTGKSLVVTSINRRNYFGETLLLRAVQDGDTQLVSEMLKVGANANRADNAGWTPLHEAVSGNHYEMVFDLLNAGAIVNCKAEHGTTPLQIAVQRENHKIIQLLLSSAADPLLKDEQGISALEQTNEISLKKLMKSYLCPAKRESESGKSLLNSTDNIERSDGKQLTQRQKKRKEDSAVVLKKPTPLSGAQKVGGSCFIEVKEKVNRNVGNKPCRWDLRSGSVKLKEKSADSKPTQKNTITMELSMHHAKVDMQPAKNICSTIGCKGPPVPSNRRKSWRDSENGNKNVSNTSSLSPTPSRCEQDEKSAREQRKDLNFSFDLTSSIKGKLEVIRSEVETTGEGNGGLCSFTSQPSICEREESIKRCAVEHTLCSESNKADVIIDKQLDIAQHSETPSPLPDAFAMKLTPVIPSGSKKGKEYETGSALDTKDQKPSEENSEMANADYGCTDSDCESDDTLDFAKKVFFSDDQSDDWSITATQDFVGKREMRDENDSDDNSEGGYTKERDYKSAFGILPVTFEPLDDFSNSVLEPISPFRPVGLNGLQDEASDNETDTVNDTSLTSRQPVELSVAPSTSQTYVLLWH
nr:PREDICTED: uncharacterized protein LOC107079519 isoform X1 [Lepisosteus oculatus]